MVKQWYSIKRVWDLIVEHEAEKYYQLVGVCRSDVFYLNPIHIFDSNVSFVSNIIDVIVMLGITNLLSNICQASLPNFASYAIPPLVFWPFHLLQLENTRAITQFELATPVFIILEHFFTNNDFTARL